MGDAVAGGQVPKIHHVEPGKLVYGKAWFSVVLVASRFRLAVDIGHGRQGFGEGGDRRAGDGLRRREGALARKARPHLAVPREEAGPASLIVAPVEAPAALPAAAALLGHLAVPVAAGRIAPLPAAGALLRPGSDHHGLGLPPLLAPLILGSRSLLLRRCFRGGPRRGRFYRLQVHIHRLPILRGSRRRRRQIQFPLIDERRFIGALLFGATPLPDYCHERTPFRHYRAPKTLRSGNDWIAEHLLPYN